MTARTPSGTPEQQVREWAHLLGPVKWRNGARTRFTALCPAHGDTTPSLDVDIRDGRFFWKCRAGCSQEEVLAAVRPDATNGHGGPVAIAITSEVSPTTAYPPRPKRSKRQRDPIAELADYCGVDRAVIEALPVEARGDRVAFLFGKDRPVKTRDFRLPKKEGIAWDPANSNATPPIWPLLKRYPATIYVTEGETDCIILRSRGLKAYAITKGAGTHLTPAQIDALRGRGVSRIILAFDADDAGSKGVSEQATAIIEAGLPVAVIHPPVNALHGETDWRDVQRSGVPWTVPDPDVEQAFTTYADLAQSDIRDVRWVSRGRFATDAITLVAGPPKAGKTTWVLDGLEAIERGAQFMGEDVRRSTALLMTEEFDPTLWEKVEGRFDSIAFLKRADAVARGWTFAESLSRSVTRCIDEGRRILVIDTLAAWASIEDENDASEVTTAIELIRAAVAGMGISVVLIHHTRKGGGEHGEGVRGSGAFQASVEILLVFTWGEGKAERQIETFSRFKGDWPTVILTRTDDGPLVLGTHEQVRDAAHEARLSQLDAEVAYTIEDLIDRWHLTRRSVEKHLALYGSWQRIAKDKQKKAGGGYRNTYSLVPMPPDVSRVSS